MIMEQNVDVIDLNNVKAQKKAIQRQKGGEWEEEPILEIRGARSYLYLMEQDLSITCFLKVNASQ